MSVRTLVSDLFGKVNYIFTSNQKKVVRLLEEQGYSNVSDCRRFLSLHGSGSILVPVCDYQMLRMGGSTIIVGDIESIVYGGNAIIDEEGTLRKKCFYKGEVECRLREMLDIPGKVLSTRELLRQLKGY